MTQSVYFCCDENRRNLVRAHLTINGIDFLEVKDDPSMPLADRQRFLEVTLLKDATLGVDNVRIEGGEAIKGIHVLNVQSNGKQLSIELDKAGDFSTYVLRLTISASSDAPPVDFDPLLSFVEFSFKVNCNTDFDCEDAPSCPPRLFEEPTLNYLARDFNSIRQVMLDRLRVLVPEWREDNPADLLHTLIDLKAYVLDYQHYQLDATNTEAYLFTARSRVSIRRHARLLNYPMHDGCSSRTWVHFKLDENISAGVPLPKGTPLLTRAPGAPSAFKADSEAFKEAFTHSPEVFETCHDLTLFSAHNEMCFYSWGSERCVLPRGATRATLKGRFEQLKPGDVLVFEEVRGAETGDPDDADPKQRFAVKLLEITFGRDDLTETDVTEIRWHSQDALPAPLCVSSGAPLGSENEKCPEAISVARGNIALADHGRTMPIEFVGEVPQSSLAYVSEHSRCEAQVKESVPPRFRPRLDWSPVSQIVPFDPGASAAGTMKLDPARAMPAIRLANKADFTGDTWEPKRDLLGSSAAAHEFVLEIENDGKARIRFGDDVNGKRPNAFDPGDPLSEGRFWARYRVGSGAQGNIGARSLAHVVTDQEGIVSIFNPMAAQGGTSIESAEAVRQNAPQAFRVQKRAVTPQDYERAALSFEGVQRAAASLRWTGSWHTVFLTVDRAGGQEIDEGFKEGLLAHMDAFRMMGYDLQIDAPRYVPLEIEMEVCVEPDYFRSQVREALLEIFSARVLPGGVKGVFHPDNFTFGQTVYLSRLYAAAINVPGVRSLRITRFQKQDQPLSSGLSSGALELGRLEIAQMENNPNFPKRGVFRLTMKGGK